MASAENQSQRNQRATWPFRRRRTVTNEDINDKKFSKINPNSEFDLTDRESIKTIFLTDSSKTIQISERNISNNSFSIPTNKSHIMTTKFQEKIPNIENIECPICCDNIPSNELKKMPCCSAQLCSSCILTHTITNINNGKVKIECPSCSQDINSSTILYNSEIPVTIRERYQQILAQDLSIKQNTYIKLCPHCNFITILDENDPTVRGKRSRSSQEWINCEQCNQQWCWSCYAPSHPNKTCRQFKKSNTQLDMWARARRLDNNNQRNAQRCPKCSIYIEKVSGCDHMQCSKCNSKFCYRCGARMRLPFYIGHDAKYSIFGCKYKLWPNRPLLRWLVRGSIFAGIIILTPVVLSALIALIAIGIPAVLIIGCIALPVFMCIECKKRS